MTIKKLKFSSKNQRDIYTCLFYYVGLLLLLLLLYLHEFGPAVRPRELELGIIKKSLVRGNLTKRLKNQKFSYVFTRRLRTRGWRGNYRRCLRRGYEKTEVEVKGDLYVDLSYKIVV